MTTHRQTTAAKNAAPPKKRFNGIALLGLGFMVPLLAIAFRFVMQMNGLADTASFALIAAVVVSAGCLIGGIVMTPRDHFFNRVTYPALRQDWEHTWACNRCGGRFQF
ncbi:MAG: hypothetical protein HY996_03845 [Micrococcales bacterium]|nr:hypothetical protein [Micrococcales bacterium]